MHQQTFCAMGCEMHAILDGGAETEAALGPVAEWFKQWEGHLSRFDEHSELSRFNRSYDEVVPVSKLFLEVLQTALWAAQASAGLVTPTMLDQLVAAGYDRSFELIEQQGAAGQQRPAGAAYVTADTGGQWRAIKVDSRARSVRRPAGLRLDFGGIAKGWAADRAASQLRDIAPALVDAGGDIALSGPRADGSAWPIAIAHPFEPGAQVALLMIERGGVATSGRGYRRWRQGDAWRHHILDARTGQPADTDVVNATVIAPSAVEAEVGAKVALILGSHAGLEWLEARPMLAGLLALADGRIVSSSRMHRYFWKG